MCEGRGQICLPGLIPDDTVAGNTGNSGISGSNCNIIILNGYSGTRSPGVFQTERQPRGRDVRASPVINLYVAVSRKITGQHQCVRIYLNLLGYAASGSRCSATAGISEFLYVAVNVSDDDMCYSDRSKVGVQHVAAVSLPGVFVVVLSPTGEGRSRCRIRIITNGDVFAA